MGSFGDVNIMRQPFRRFVLFEQNRIIAASLGIKARLDRDAIPTLDNASEVMQIEKPLSNRKRRKVRI